MASVFRRRISNQLISILKPFLDGSEKVAFYDVLPLSINLNQPLNCKPQFEILWKDVLRLKPSLNEQVHLTSAMTCLKNQDFPTQDGIFEITCEKNKQEKIIFSVEQELFISSVLVDICSRIEVIPNSSTYFRNIPPESVIVEYSSPNIAKPFHYGHFRSTIMGNFLSNICKYVGHDVTRINYVGDWGLQYGILALGFSLFGSEKKLESDPLRHLFEVYKKACSQSESNPDFNEKAKNYFKKMESGDKDILAEWKRLREISLNEMESTYKRLNICFDEIHSESMYAKHCTKILQTLMDAGLAKCNDDGSVEAQLPDDDKEEKVILQKNDGTTLYLSRDLAAAIDRRKTYHFDSMYYVVDSTQSKHFNHLKAILKNMGHEWGSDVHHVPFGRILNFSTRKGTLVFLQDILDEARERTLEKMKESPNTKITENLEDVADVLGVSSLTINDLKCKRKKDDSFSWDKALNLGGDSGTSLQYCHARLCSIKEKCGYKVNTNCILTPLAEPEALSLIAHLAKFDEVIYQSYINIEPCILVHYLFNLRNEVGTAIKALQVKGSNIYVAQARLLMFHCAQLVLKKGLEILGITPLNKM